MSFTLPLTESCLSRSAIVGDTARFSDAFWAQPTIARFNPITAIMMAITPIPIGHLLFLD
jgi:hypothetical protein